MYLRWLPAAELVRWFSAEWGASNQSEIDPHSGSPKIGALSVVEAIKPIGDLQKKFTPSPLT